MYFAYFPHPRDRTSVDVILRLFCSRYVPQRCRGDSRIVPKRSPRTILTATNEQTSPTAVGEDIILPPNKRLTPSSRLPRFCKHTSLPFVLYSAFSRKRRNQKMPPLYSATRKQASAYALPWLKRRLYFRRAEVVGTLPGFRCPSIRAAVCDFFAAPSV